MFEAIKGIIGDISAGSIKDQRITLSQEQLSELEAKLKIFAGELAEAHRRIAEVETDNANFRLQHEHLQPTSHGLTEEDITALKFLDTGSALKMGQNGGF